MLQGYARHIHGGSHSFQNISFEKLSWIVRTCFTLSSNYMSNLMSWCSVTKWNDWIIWHDFFIRRISDLVGSNVIPFPSLKGLVNLERLWVLYDSTCWTAILRDCFFVLWKLLSSHFHFLRLRILRNCLISGSIPAYVGEMTKLKTL